MLGDELNRPKQMQLSKSSLFGDEADQKKLREMVEDRDKTIRTLTKKIDKLQSNLKKTALVKNSSNHEQQNSEENNYFEMLKLQVNKTKELEDIIMEITKRINIILSDITHDNSFTDNSQEIRHMVQQLQFMAQNQSVSSGSLEDHFQNSFSISKDWVKNIDILEGTIKSVKSKCIGYKQQAHTLKLKLQESNKKIESLLVQLKQGDQVKHLQAELKEQRRQKQKLRGLLDRTQFQKNQFMNKINSIGLREVEVKAKTKQELLQYSKELNYRVKDLQKQKETILKQTYKQRETEMKKYQDVLKKLRTIKQTSRMGKSFA